MKSTKTYLFALLIAAVIVPFSTTSMVDATTSNSDATDRPFITSWETTAAGESIVIPVGNATGTYTVDWGDGNITTHAEDATHTYDTPGTHTVKISGDFTIIRLGDNGTNAAKLQSIDQWGTIQWDTMEYAFRGASSMIYNATDTPDLSDVTSTSYMFYGTSKFTGDISGWNVSSVTYMAAMFEGATSFNQPLNSWDV